MKVTFAWNVWDNYFDSAIASEMVAHQNSKQKVFSDISMISLGGYREPPADRLKKYLDDHIFVDCPDLPLLSRGHKFAGTIRIMLGLAKAFEFAKKQNSDYLVVTNGDAWYFSLIKLKQLLISAAVQKSAVSMRVGTNVALGSNYGLKTPMMDDHFMIFDVRKCDRHNILNYGHTDKIFYPHFGYYGGIHYVLTTFIDQKVPDGLFHIYSNCLDTIGHYGDAVGWYLVPWQYQPTYEFLHANTFYYKYLEPLRSAYLIEKGFSELEFVKEQIEKHPVQYSKLRKVKGNWVMKRTAERYIKDSVIQGYENLRRHGASLNLSLSYSKDEIEVYRKHMKVSSPHIMS